MLVCTLFDILAITVSVAGGVACLPLVGKATHTTCVPLYFRVAGTVSVFTLVLFSSTLRTITLGGRLGDPFTSQRVPTLLDI